MFVTPSQAEPTFSKLPPAPLGKVSKTMLCCLAKIKHKMFKYMDNFSTSCFGISNETEYVVVIHRTKTAKNNSVLYKCVDVICFFDS